MRIKPVDFDLFPSENVDQVLIDNRNVFGIDREPLALCHVALGPSNALHHQAQVLVSSGIVPIWDLSAFVCTFFGVLGELAITTNQVQVDNVKQGVSIATHHSAQLIDKVTAFLGTRNSNQAHIFHHQQRTDDQLP
jgi:hypothetical protein